MRSRRKLLAVSAAVVLGMPLGAAAASLDVNAEASFSGSFGLEVSPGSNCLADIDVVLESQILPSGETVGCSTVSAQNVLVFGNVLFKAGDQIVLREGFSVQPGASFTAELDRSLTPFAWVEDRRPDDEIRYNASFRVKIDDLNLGLLGSPLGHLVGYSKDGSVQFKVRFRLQFLPPPAEKRLVLAALEDGRGR